MSLPFHAKTMLDYLKAQRDQLVAILSAPLGAAGDDYISVDQRDRYMTDLDRIDTRITEIERQHGIQ